MRTAFLLFLFVGVISKGLGQDLNQGLEVYLKFNGNTVDSSGNSNNPTSISGTFVNDRLGMSQSALKLSSSNSESLFISNSNLPSSTYSLSFWVKMESLPTNSNHMVLVSIGGSTKESGISVTNNYFGYTGWGNYTLSNSSTYAYANGTLPNTSSWYHIISVRDNNSLSLYVNGVLQTTISATETTVYSGNNLGLSIGRRADNSAFADFTIDEFRYYSRALSPSEIAELYSISNSITNNVVYQSACFPNPSSGKLNLKHTSIQPGSLIKIYNAAGIEIQQNCVIRRTEGIAEIEIPVSGIYFIQFESEGILYRNKVSIQ